MPHKYKKTISKITFTLLSSLSLISVSYAADLNQQPKRNPFTKLTPIAPSTLPSGLPTDLPPPNYNQISGGVNKDVMETPESREARIVWVNLKIVGIFNNNVLLRLDENDDDNSSGSSNNGGNGNNNNNNGGGNSSNGSGSGNTPVTTIMTTLGDKFLLNKNYYILKKEKNSYVIYNRNNQPMHSMTLESHPTRLIPRISGNGSGSGSGSSGSSNNGGNSATR